MALKVLRRFMPGIGEWYPKYPDGTVKVSMAWNYPHDSRLYHVSVWGADDFGMEYETLSKKEARRVWASLMKSREISVPQLLGLGFKRA